MDSQTAQDTKPTGEDSGKEDILIDLPEYHLRRIGAARDPLAVIEGYRLQVVLRLATICGVRMCPLCPRCNSGVVGCSDRFGNNLRPMGGALGAMTALGGSTEHQKKDPPQFHGEGHIACAHQFGTLVDIAESFKAGSMCSDDMKDFHQWLHREDVLDEEVYEEFLAAVNVLKKNNILIVIIFL